MPTLVTLHQIEDLAHEESKDEILLGTNLNTELHIIIKTDKTIITLPFGNKFDIINGTIVIHER